MHFERQIRVQVPLKDVWSFLWDVERLARCVPGCQEARTIEAQSHYFAKVSEKVGPFRVSFDMDVRVKNMDELRRLEVVVTGKDTKLASNLKVELGLGLKEQDQGTEVNLEADINLLGKLAALGHGIIQRKAEEVVNRFAQAIKEELER